MNINQVFSGSFLKAEDLPQDRSVRVTIAKVELKEFEDGKKLALHFSGKEKALICNKTNAAILAEVCGSSDTDHWIGKPVKLVVKRVEFSGKLVPAIRVVLEDAPPAPKPVAVSPSEHRPGEDGPKPPFDSDDVGF